MNPTDRGAGAVPPLVKLVTVPVDVARAFELFTAGMSEWWPLDTHSVGEDSAHAVLMDGRVGGPITEWVDDGRTEVWGHVTAWEPPARVAFDWHPGQPETHATHIVVRFTDAGVGTDVELTHSGWDARPDGVLARTEYDPGWDYVLARYVGHATED